MDIIHLLAGTAVQTPLTGKPTGNAEPGAQFASVLEDATNVHGTPKGLTLLAAIRAPHVAATAHQHRGLAHHARVPHVTVGGRIQFVVAHHVEHSPVTSSCLPPRSRRYPYPTLPCLQSKIRANLSVSPSGLGGHSALP